MHAAPDRVVLIHYTLTNDAGEVLDSSEGGEPLAYLHGRGNVDAGLDEALDGRRARDGREGSGGGRAGRGLWSVRCRAGEARAAPLVRLGRKHQAGYAIPGA